MYEYALQFDLSQLIINSRFFGCIAQILCILAQLLVDFVCVLLTIWQLVTESVFMLLLAANLANYQEYTPLL